jgi:hypothetical protein
MKLEYTPVLSTQRELYRFSRGAETFREYLRTLIDPASEELRVPLPETTVERTHLPRFLEALVGIGADAIGARATAEAEAALSSDPGSYRVTLVANDDVGGGWAYRASTEFSHRRGEAGLARRGWIAGVLWASESYAAAGVREEVLTSIFRTAYVQSRGPARTLRELLIQEGSAMRRAGARNPVLDPARLIATRQILRPLLDVDDLPTLTAAVFGDPAAKELGYPVLGLPPRAGLALALYGRLEPRDSRSSKGGSGHRASP